jgi:hypothetical protein
MDDRPANRSIDHDGAPAATDRPPTNPAAMVPLEEAAARLGISVNAVRQRIKRRTLLGVRTGAGWLVATDPATTATGCRDDTDQPPTDHRPQPTDQADIAPLVGLVADLTRENRELAAAAAVWQIRAMQAEERLKQLTAGETSESPDLPEPTAGRDPRPWWWRLWERWS